MSWLDRLRPSKGAARSLVDEGNMLLQSGNAEEALRVYTAAVAEEPGYAAAYYNMGNAYALLGRADAAIDAYRKALSLKSDFVDAQVGLGSALEDLGHLAEAEKSYRDALLLKPDYAEVHSNLGNVLRTLGRLDDAVASYQRALALRPDYLVARNRLGMVLLQLGRFAEAAANFREVLATHAGDALVHLYLAIAQKELGQIDDAIASYGRALAIEPSQFEANNNLGVVLTDAGRLDEAVARLEQALAIRPDSAEALCNLGFAMQQGERLADAAEIYRRALVLNPDLAAAHNNLGLVLTRLGQLDAAVASLNRALAIDAVDAGVHSNLLFIHNYRADQTPAELLESARAYGNLVARRARRYTTWPNTVDPARRIIVGLVSGDLCSHPVGFFMEGVLKALAADHSLGIEVVAYPTHFVADQVTQRIRQSCPRWNYAVGLSDEGLAERIRVDAVDVLIDLSGHTAHNRLPVFAWKPAPVQVTWLGYLATTGVAAIDYVIADRWTFPESEAVNFVEKVWYMPESYLSFTPPNVRTRVTPLPALTERRVTFGCFNNLAKVNEAVVALWARLLKAVPGSRLFLKAKQFEDVSVRQNVIGRFAVHGIEAERLILASHVAMSDYLAPYQKVDIALDPFPYPGITTSIESLWMGVPVITLAGKTFLSRQGVGILTNAGLSEWIATDPDDYVARAAAHAGDLHRLSSLREVLRDRVVSSPIFDTAQFAYHFAMAMRGMWQVWCQQHADRVVSSAP